MKPRVILLLLILSFIGTGCTSIRYSSDRTPLDDVITGYKRAVVVSSEKSILEEFIKYKEMGETFALYRITEISLVATTEISGSSTESAKASIKIPLNGAEIGAGKEIGMKDTEGGKITIKLEPVAGTPAAYIKIREIFKKQSGLNEVYGLAYYDAFGKLVPEGAADKCKTALYCIPMAGLPVFRGNKGFAYTIDIKKFRAMINEIREFKDESKK